MIGAFPCMNPVVVRRSGSLSRCLLQILLLGLSALLLNAVLVKTCLGQSEAEALEYRIKAAFLCKFANYVEWPGGAFARAVSPVEIGVAGDERLRQELARLVQGKTVNGRPIAVRAVRPGRPFSVHILYVGELAPGEATQLQAQVRGRPVLLVSDVGRSVALDSMVRFVLVDQRLRFDVTLAPVAAGGLKVSALMLSAARRVERQP